MDPIRPDAPAQPPLAPAAASALGGDAGPRIEQDFEMYLRMLTTQLENQDPLNPLNPEDYAAQLAQFSAVEQQIRTNTLLEAMGEALNLSGLADLAGWVGLEARAAGPVGFDGAPVTLYPVPAGVADSATLIVRDAAGAEIQRLAIPPVAEPVVWAGVAEGGAPLAPGIYSFEVESRARGEVVATSVPESYARVTEMRAGPDGPVAVLAGGVELPASAVRALRG